MSAVEKVLADRKLIWAELCDDQADDQADDRYVSGTAVIIHAAEVSREDLEAAVNHEYGDGWDRLIVEVQHLTLTPRIKWCSNRDGFGCDSEGEWHSHWFRVKHNPLSDCCHTLAMPVWPKPAWLNGGAS